MLRRLSVTASLLACLGFTVPATADQPTESPSADEQRQTDEQEQTDDETVSEKREDIRRLLQITGTPKLGLRIAKRIIDNIKRSYPDVPEKFWAEFEDEMNEKTFIKMILPMYEDHFTHEEVKKLIEFYQTDVGQKYVEKLPTMTEQSMQAGRTWGRELGQKIVDKLRAEGYE